MIRSFQIRNFKSIADMTARLTYAEGRAPGNWEEGETWPFLQAGARVSDRFVPVLAVYGANASGKSNLIEAFSVFRQILSRGIAGLYSPNKLIPAPPACRFSIAVSLGGADWQYSVEYDDRRILFEELAAPGGDALFRIEEGKAALLSPVATENYPEARLRDAIRVECRDLHGNMARPFLSCLARSFAGLSPAASGVWGECAERLWVSFTNRPLLSQGIDMLAGEDTEEARAAATDKIGKLLRKFDFAIRRLSMTRTKPATDFPPDPRGPSPQGFPGRPAAAPYLDSFTSLHSDARGNPVAFNFLKEESQGTQILAGLLAVCLWALEKGKTVLIDELDRSLHPFILTSLIGLFKSRRHNRKNAQLVFTLHDPTPLDGGLLRVSEVAVINKTAKKGSTFSRISDFQGSRNVFNFRRQYLSGAYSGIPFPYI